MPLIVSTLEEIGTIMAMGQSNNPNGAHAILVCSAMDIDDGGDGVRFPERSADPWFGSDERDTQPLLVQRRTRRLARRQRTVYSLVAADKISVYQR